MDDGKRESISAHGSSDICVCVCTKAVQKSKVSSIIGYGVIFNGGYRTVAYHHL
jgi:hypothetical protein